MSVLPGERDTIRSNGFLICIKKSHRPPASSETFFQRESDRMSGQSRRFRDAPKESGCLPITDIRRQRLKHHDCHQGRWPPFPPCNHNALRSSGTSPNFRNTVASWKSPVAGSSARLNPTCAHKRLAIRCCLSTGSSTFPLFGTVASLAE